MKIRTHRYLVTGLCMQGNKGGPALVLSLVDAIRREIPDATFVFSVPASPQEWPRESAWAHRYGFEVCQNATLSCVVPPFCFRPGRLRRMLGWWKTLRSCDALIQMSAICYVGPPSAAGTLRSMFRSPRVFDFLISRVARRPMLAWTQSYGPLSTAVVRFFAKRDLARQPIIFCRGDDCAAAVRKLLPSKQVMSFPDVAVNLPYDPDWGPNYLTRNFGSIGRFVTLSPSAVLFSRDIETGERNRHVRQCLDICRRLIDAGYSVMLVPHTLRPAQHDPNMCDFAVAEIVHRNAANPRVALLHEDLAPTELKAIIAHAEFHVGARYHSVVAALASGVPAISLSWHPKYRDLMRAYGLQDFVIPENDPAAVGPLIDRMHAEHEDSRKELAEKHVESVHQVRENARLFCALLPDV